MSEEMWTFDDQSAGFIRDETGISVAQVNSSHSQCVSRGILIAAAPDLLRACKAALEVMPHGDDCNCMTGTAKEMLWDAVKKAEGKP